MFNPNDDVSRRLFEKNKLPSLKFNWISYKGSYFSNEKIENLNRKTGIFFEILLTI